MMSDMVTVSATTFVRRFARYQHEAIRCKLIVVTSHGRIVGGYLSADELADYERLKARERQAFRVGELSAEIMSEFKAAEL